MKVFVWINSSLDGACSALALKNILQCQLTVTETNSFNFPGLLKGWVVNEFSKYDKVFIVGLMVPGEISALLDNEKIVVIDNYPIEASYKHAKTVCMDTSSCIDVILDKFNHHGTDKQQLLYNMVSDYTSNTLDNPDSIKLNAVHMNFNRPKVNKFIDRFVDGFDEFNVHEKNAINLYFKKLRDTVSSTNFFAGMVKDHKVVSCFANYAMNDVANFVLNKHSAEIAIIVNLETQTVLFKRSKKVDAVKVNILAEKLCDGSGRDDVAVGRITETFLTFSKTLQQCT